MIHFFYNIKYLGVKQPEVPKKQNIPEWEPELLRAINIARKEQVQFLTNCALVCRGLPVKIVIK